MDYKALLKKSALYALPFAAAALEAGVEAFADAVLNAGSLDKTTVVHALGAALLAETAALKAMARSKAAS